MLASIYNQIYRQYKEKQKINIDKYVKLLENSSYTSTPFLFYNAVSAISSSKIEGEPMEIDSYVKHKLMKIKYQKALTQKPNDLFSAYEFAQKNKLSKSNFLKAHKLISKHILVASEQGKTRNSEMIVLDDRQRVLYEACPKDTVNEIFTTFFKNITTLLKKKNSIDEIFFYASLLHLVCVNIHPFADGNGRSARLLEKWFLAEKLGEKAWFIQSELYYWNHREMYCKNLSKQGVFYEKINYDTSLDFLLMLPKSLKNINK